MLFKLAGPLLVAQMTQMLMSVSDTLMAGRLSSADMAGAAIASSVFFPVMIFIQGIIMALPPIISRSHGSEKYTDIPIVGHQALYIAVALSLVVYTASFYTSPYFYTLIWTLSYNRFLPNIYAMSLLHFLLSAFIRSLGSIVKDYPILNLYGDNVRWFNNQRSSQLHVFIYGKLGVPAYGGAGCGIATGLVFAVMMVCNWVYLKHSKKLVAPFFQKSTPFSLRQNAGALLSWDYLSD